VGPYHNLGALLRQEASVGRNDLTVHAAVIAEVSLAAAPFVIPFLHAVVAERRPLRALDVGCGTGMYVQALLEADPQLRVDAIDLAPDVIAVARARLEALALETRAELHVGDVRDFAASSGAVFGLVTLLNSVYYFDREDRVDLLGRLRALLTDGGELVVVTMATPGSVASAHLHFMLACQSGAASLPEPGQIEADLERTGFRVVETCSLVPTEPFIGVRAR
jgi:4-hydroxy-2,2'-bipyrrole-5-carbaldehyde O-methyltransferase